MTVLTGVLISFMMYNVVYFATSLLTFRNSEYRFPKSVVKIINAFTMSTEGLHRRPRYDY